MCDVTAAIHTLPDKQSSSDSTFVERPCRPASAIPCRAVQPLTGDWLGSFGMQVSLYYAAVEEVQPRPGQPEAVVNQPPL